MGVGGATRVLALALGLALEQARSTPFPSDVGSSALHHHEMSRVRPHQLQRHPSLVPGGAARQVSADHGVTLSVDATVLPAEGGRVQLTVSTAPGYVRNASDWIGLYSPANADVQAVVPVKMASLGNLTSGQPWAGSDADVVLAVDLPQMRADYQFVFFARDWWCTEGLYGCSWFMEDLDDAVAVAQSDPVALESYTIPVNPRVLPHISPVTRVHEPGAWRVVWTSGLGADQDATLFFGVSPSISCVAEDDRTASVAATTDSFVKEDLCGSPANDYGYRDPGYTKSAVIRGVLPGQTLYYCPAAAASGSPTGAKVYSFKAPPAPYQPGPTEHGHKHGHKHGDEHGDGHGHKHSHDGGQQRHLGTASVGAERTVLAAFGDLGRGTMDDTDCWQEYGHPAVYTSSLLQQEAEAGTVDGVFHIGDISYSVGYLASWDIFLDMITSFAAKIPYFINQGNHEYDWFASEWKNESDGHPLPVFCGDDSGGECGVVTSTLVPLPLWYSTNIGCFHVVAMNTEVNFTIGSPQWEWLDNDLRRVDKTVTPWILFGGHRPMYIDSSYSGDQLVSAALVHNVEPLLLKYGVQLAIWGHNHAVQRLCAVEDFGCVQHSTGPENTFSHPEATVHMVIGTGGADFTKNAFGAPFAELVFYKWGYARISANATHLDWEFVNNANGEVLDVMHIVQDNPLEMFADPATPREEGGTSRAAYAGALTVAFGLCAASLCAAAMRRGCKRTGGAAAAGASSTAAAATSASPAAASKEGLLKTLVGGPKGGWTRVAEHDEPAHIEVKVLSPLVKPAEV